MTVIVYEHPLSPYAQKVKIALDEKGVAYETKMPSAIGSGQPDREFLQANPRGEVPALIDGETMIFDSTIILEYIEDKWPTPALLPKSPAARANARTIEDVMDTLFEPINWGMGEIRWFKRAEGERARTLEARAMSQARGIYEWLTRHLGSAQWFNGETFGWGDLSVVPYLNGARGRNRGGRLAQRHDAGCGGGAERRLQARISRSSPGMDDPLRRVGRRVGRHQEQQHPLLERIELTTRDKGVSPRGPRHHPAQLSELALLREGARRLRHQEARLALGHPAGDHAEARSHSVDRRLPQDSGDADRCGHLLRQPDHPARDRAPPSDAEPFTRE